MAVRQYVGARYVPRFCGAYDVTQQYDALDVVDNGAGTSYIARKTVPAGTPLTDSTYWVVYGASSGAILDLQSRMDTAENDINNLEGDVSSLDGRIDTLESDMTTAKGNIQTLQQLVNRRFVLIGDSYADGYGSGENYGWTQQIKSMFGLSNNDCYISRLGGTGFVGNVATRFIDLLNNAYSLVTNPSTITDVVVCGGYNDIRKANVANSVLAFCNRAHELFPNATVTLGFCGYDARATNDGGTIRWNIPSAISAWYTAGSYKTRCMYGLEYCLRMHSGLMGSDGTHPSTAGYTSLSKAIASGILGGSACGYNMFDMGEVVTFTDITGHNQTLVERLSDKIALISMNWTYNYITLGSSKPSALTWFKIGTLGTNNKFHGGVGDDTLLMQTCARGDCVVDIANNGHHIKQPCYLGIMNDGLYIYLCGTDDTTGYFYDYTNAKTIGLGGTWMFDPLYV